MDPVYHIPQSPGAPLFPVSPERVNRQPIPQSPSLPVAFLSPSRQSDVQGKVAQFNNLTKEAALKRKDNEAALRRAVLGREEAEGETRRLKEENRTLREKMEESERRDGRITQKIETFTVSHLRPRAILS